MPIRLDKRFMFKWVVLSIACWLNLIVCCCCFLVECYSMLRNVRITFWTFFPFLNWIRGVARPTSPTSMKKIFRTGGNLSCFVADTYRCIGPDPSRACACSIARTILEPWVCKKQSDKRQSCKKKQWIKWLFSMTRQEQRRDKKPSANWDLQNRQSDKSIICQAAIRDRIWLLVVGGGLPIQ